MPVLSPFGRFTIARLGINSPHRWNSDLQRRTSCILCLTIAGDTRRPEQGPRPPALNGTFCVGDLEYGS
jgi:hypothetical protein